jgi:hypothetical protein
MSAGAAVYTTNRGKNKKHKATDASKKGSANQATRLNTALAANKLLFSPVEEERQPGMRGLGSSSFKAKLAREVELRARATVRCSNPGCPFELAAAARAAAAAADAPPPPPPPAAARPALQRCACTLASYCGADCQRAAWPAHKAQCKEKRADLEAVAAAREKAAAELVAEEEAERAARALGGGGGGGGRGSARQPPPPATAAAAPAEDGEVDRGDEEEEEEEGGDDDDEEEEGEGEEEVAQEPR